MKLLISSEYNILKFNVARVVATYSKFLASSTFSSLSFKNILSNKLIKYSLFLANEG
jgi:hypothetical protein